MKYLGFLLSLSIALALAFALSRQIGQVPPLIRLLDPFSGLWQNAYSEDELAMEVLQIVGLSAPVEVIYDENLIPHIFASNPTDLYRAQGYVTAQHRLWQMEFQTMAAAGRLSEIVGVQALEFDRMQRRKGLGYGAEKGLAFLHAEDPETLGLMTAFAEGVSQYITQLSPAQLPIEYKLLNNSPEPWTVYKTMLLLKYMADMLVEHKDLEFTNLRQLIGKEWMERLFPDFPLVNDPVIESSKKWNFVPLSVQKPEGIVYPDSMLLLNPMPSPEPGIGSNNWAVAGSKTKNGHPILANDPHLGLNMPSLWYAMQLTTPEYSVKGATLPGALGVISGFNENIAWGVTNATRDLRDWYAITFKDDSRLEYRYNNQWVQSAQRIEEIKIKNQSTFKDTVIYTHYGPVVYDPSFRANDQRINFALKWTAHEGSNEQKTFLKLNQGKSHHDFILALNHYASPAQNFAFASSTGDIALKVQGKFPLKWEGQGKFLMDGNNPAFEWAGFIPPDQNPATLNPSRGFVSSANQHSVDPSYPYYVFDPSFEHYRNRRLNNRLTEMNEITIEDMKSLQLDNFHLHASEVLPVMLEYLMDSSLTFTPWQKEILDKLQEWDFHTSPEQLAPAFFAEWWKAYEKITWGRWEMKGRPIVLPNSYQTSRLLMEEPESEIYNQPETPAKETAKDYIRESFVTMSQSVAEGKDKGLPLSWAAYKKTSLQHLVPNFKTFGYFDIPIGGGKGIINATSERHGASWRMVVEMGEEVKAYGIYPGGQSGNPGSRFYGDLVQKWAAGEYLIFDLRRKEDHARIMFTTTLMPSP